jgi:hypothetical protein
MTSALTYSTGATVNDVRPAHEPTDRPFKHVRASTKLAAAPINDMSGPKRPT